MRNRLLLSYRFKWAGLALFIPFAALFAANTLAGFELSFLAYETRRPSANILNPSNGNLTDELALSGLILSLILMSLARERQEDEYVNHIRLQSFQLAVLINYVLLLAILFLSYGFGFLAMLYLHIPSLLLLFLLIFHARLKLFPHLAKNSLA